MLTKDLIKSKLRKGRVYPDKIESKCLEATELATNMLKFSAQAKDKTQKELEFIWEQAGLSLKPWYAAFKKLIFDMASWQDIDSKLEDKRWNWFYEAQSLRTETLFPSFEAFQEAFAAGQTRAFAQIAAELYGDLPDKRCLESIPQITASELIHRYNCAQVQGLIIKAKQIEITLLNSNLEERRLFFRALKFHQLVAEVLDPYAVKDKKGDLRVRLSGPLSILQSPQTYGAKLANFFPRVLLLNQWKCEALIDLSPAPSKKGLKLELDQKCGIKSHYHDPGSYIPEEFQYFVDNFNRLSDSWKASFADTFIPLGRQSYCFPDLCFSNTDKQTVYMELFHKWHKGQLEHRLQVLENNPARNLLVGVARNLFKIPAMKNNINNSSWFSENGILFSDFPSVKSVLTTLSSRGSI
ncbi:MAG: DUF790 family protein [Oligoflexales bacterium]